jgi:aromatic ring-opening dioxygenase LigB subunit
MPLIYACIAPHAGDLIPETVKDGNIVAVTRNSMKEMGAKLEALNPEVVVIVNPHGFRVSNAMNIAITEKSFAEWSPDVKLDFDVDQSLANAIADKAEGMSVPVVRYIYGASGGDACFVPLDWGAVVPLYFMGHKFEPRPKIVHISPMKKLSLQTHYDFGRAMGQVIKESDKRIAFVASADQGHAHDENGPYAYDPASAQYDAWMQEVIRRGNLDELLDADPQLVENGKPDSLWPTLILAGVLKENPMKTRLLSYEVNIYFGIMCAEFQS